ncbi:MAG: glycosyltransferase [Sphingobacteriales bacterium]|nr:glycosyltransferase [Sphingobacteriales bacterium]
MEATDYSTLPLVSIIIPTFNQASTLERCILSVLEQHYPRVEFIIIDGGSDESTLRIIRQYESHLAYWISEADEGIYDAYNKGIARSTGDYLYFLGSDDQLEKGVLQAVFGSTDRHCDIIYGEVHAQNGPRQHRGAFSPQRLVFETLCHQAVFYKRNLFDKKGKYDIRYQVKADHVFHFACFGDDSVRTCYVPLQIATYEGKGYSAETADPQYLQDEAKLMLQYLAPHLSEKERNYIQKRGEERNIYYQLRHQNLWKAATQWLSFSLSSATPLRYLKKGAYWLAQRFTGGRKYKYFAF